MTRNDIYTRPIDYVASRNNNRLAQFVNIPVKEVHGQYVMNLEGVVQREPWHPQFDWNQMMLVVDEIEKLDNIQVVIRGSGCFIARLIPSVENGVEVIEPEILCQYDSGSRLESMFRCAVDFIVNVAR